MIYLCPFCHQRRTLDGCACVEPPISPPDHPRVAQPQRRSKLNPIEIYMIALRSGRSHEEALAVWDEQS
jgi:hypothetical protein